MKTELSGRKLFQCKSVKSLLMLVIYCKNLPEYFGLNEVPEENNTYLSIKQCYTRAWRFESDIEHLLVYKNMIFLVVRGDIKIPSL